MNFESLSEEVSFPTIAREIKQMVETDQIMREQDDSWDDQVDITNTNRMKEIVTEIGWPTISKVGKAVADDAWLLVQHADHDVAFQFECLVLMKSEPDNEVDKINIAYLEDRVRVNQGKGQLFGTQFIQENNKHVPREIEDIEKIDERRAEIGLGPLQEQIDMMYDKYPLK